MTGAHPLVIWFVNQYAGSPIHGMEFRHYELGRELAALGHTVVVISGSYSHLFTHQPSTTGTYTMEDVGGLTYCWVKVPTYRRATSVRRVLNMLVFMVRLYRLPVQRLPTPDAIVVSSPSLFPILPAQRWSRRLRARLVFEVRDVWPLTLQELGGLSSRHPLIALMGWFENRAYRVADAVVSVLPAAGSHMQSHGMTPSKLSIIPNGVSPEVLGGGKGSAPAQVQAATARHTFNVGFVGTLGTANALDALIEAARVLADDDVGVVIVGGGSEEKRLRALAAGVANVSFTGPVSKVDVPATLALFDACYVGYHRSPLYRFGISPNKVFDYMAAARPVILAAAAANDPVRDAACGADCGARRPGGACPGNPGSAGADASRARPARRERSRLRRAGSFIRETGGALRTGARSDGSMKQHARERYRSLIGETLGIAPERVALFARGRVALYAILRGLGIGPGDEVILPAFTCVAVPNAILYTGARPIWVDIDPQTFCLDPAAVEAAIGSATRAIIAQNTFGLSADLAAIMGAVARRRDVVVIDDSTHGLGGRYRGEPNGATAPLAFFSTQWSKPISTGLGGFAVDRDGILGASASGARRCRDRTIGVRVAALRTLIFGRERAGGGRLFRGGRAAYRAFSRLGVVPGSSSRRRARRDSHAARLPGEALRVAGAPGIGAPRPSVDGDRAATPDRAPILRLARCPRVGRPRPNRTRPSTHSSGTRSGWSTGRGSSPRAARAGIDLGDWFVSPVHPVTDRLDRWGYVTGSAPAC